MISCVTIARWLALPTHVEVTFAYLTGGRRVVSHKQLPAGTLRTPHEESKQLMAFKQAKTKELEPCRPKKLLR